MCHVICLMLWLPIGELKYGFNHLNYNLHTCILIYHIPSSAKLTRTASCETYDLELTLQRSRSIIASWLLGSAAIPAIHPKLVDSASH